MKYLKKIAFIFVIMNISFNALADYQMSYRQCEKGQYISFSGEILFPTQEGKLKKILKSVNGKGDITMIVGMSLGGWAPSFEGFMKDLRNKCSRERGSACKITTVFTDTCGSACVRLPLLSDYAISLPNSQFLVHRRFLIHPNLKIKSAKSMSDSYIELGGNPQWFEKNGERVFGQTTDYGIYAFTKEEEVESSLIDFQASSIDELDLSCDET